MIASLRRGFVRLWTVASLCWMAGTIFIGAEVYPKGHYMLVRDDAWIVANSASPDSKAPPDLSQYGTVSQSKPEEAIPTDPKRRRVVIEYTAIALVPPVIVYIFAFQILPWIVRGFRQSAEPVVPG